MSAQPRARARDVGWIVGELPTGPNNAITDVNGVCVGHATIVEGDGELQPGTGPVRTGVTVILPHGDNLYEEKVRAAVHTINGFGKATGFEQVRELGSIEAPIALTNTLNVGLVADALVQYSIQQSPRIGIPPGGTVNVVVGETNDGYLNDIQGRHVRAEHVFAAIESASVGAVEEGAVGAGKGTRCYGWKGGIGTASRVIKERSGGFTVGALVQSNFGRPRDLLILGVPVGRRIEPPKSPRVDKGSVMVVLATDAPLTARQIQRICVRAAAGLARTGSFYGQGSGDFVIGFSSTARVSANPECIVASQEMVADETRALDALFVAVTESVEEAVLNSMCCAKTTTGMNGNTVEALPIDEVRALVEPA